MQIQTNLCYKVAVEPCRFRIFPSFRAWHSFSWYVVRDIRVVGRVPVQLAVTQSCSFLVPRNGKVEVGLFGEITEEKPRRQKAWVGFAVVRLGSQSVENITEKVNCHGEVWEPAENSHNATVSPIAAYLWENL